LGFVFIALFLSACDKAEQAPSAPAIKNDAQWSQYISAHSLGSISKTETISIHFVNDIVDEAKSLHALS
jgi:hypothetical protein